MMRCGLAPAAAVSVLLFVCFAALPAPVAARDLYCGEQNCYELLKVERTVRVLTCAGVQL
jgi:hypothetical protein